MPPYRRFFFSIPAVFLLFLLCTAADALPAWRSPPGGGRGSYAVVVPAPGKHSDADPGGDSGPVTAVPPVIAPNVDRADGGKTPTNDWWTPLAWLDPHDLPDPAALDPMKALCWEVFSEPLVFQPQRGGLAVSLNIPDSQRAAMKKGVLTAGAGFMLEVVGDAAHGGKGISPYFNAFFDQDLYLGSTAAGWNDHAYSDVKVKGWSDWFVNFSVSAPSKTEILNVTAGAGSPFLLVKTSAGQPQVTFRTWNVGKVIPLSGASFSLNASMAKDQKIVTNAFAVVNKVPYGAPSAPAGAEAYSTYTVYGVFGPSGSTWELKDTQYNSEQRGPFSKWQDSTAYSPGNPVEPLTANNFFYTAGGYGTSGATEPVWPTAAGGTVTDGGVTWTANPLEIRNVLNTAVCSAGNRYSVAVLPYPAGKGIYDEPDETEIRAILTYFAPYAFAEVTDTRVSPVYAPSAAGADMTVTYAFTTVPAGTEIVPADAPLSALYPHQYIGQKKISLLDKALKQIPAASWAQGWSWPALKGPMMLSSGNSFVNELEIPPCLPALVHLPDTAEADRMAAYLRQALESENPRFLSQGSYFGAQQMHRLAMLLPVAEMIRSEATDPAGVDEAARNIYSEVEKAMADWMTATLSDGTTLKNAAQHVFYYNEPWGSLISTPEDGFAADSLLNDHHFHYGYFVKTAAELARWEKTHPTDRANKGWAAAYGPMVQLLIRDIANISRTGMGSEPDFPFLRNFSPYAGHSWASGSSRGNQGGQQESTSEAIQAWAALLLWAQLNYPINPGNLELEKWAAYMFASEVNAAEMYWFGFTGDAAFKPHLSFRQYSVPSARVPSPYLPSMVSQINQNEMTYQTCFGNPPLLKLGIQILPFTGSSLYLGTASGNADALVKGYLENDLPQLGDGGISPSFKDKLIMLEAMGKNYTKDPASLITPVAGASPLDSWRMQWEIPTPTFDNLLLQDTSRGAVYWWINSLLSSGLALHPENDADHLSAASFSSRDGFQTVYTAYNPGTSPLTIRFDDDKTLTIPPLSYALERENRESGSGCSSGIFRPGMLWFLLPGLFLF